MADHLSVPGALTLEESTPEAAADGGVLPEISMNDPAYREALKQKASLPGASKQGLVQFFYRDEQGGLDYWGVLNVQFGEYEGQWVGVCQELGTAMQADTPEEVEVALLEGIELQLNGTAELCDIFEYLADFGVSITPVSIPQETGFAVSGSVQTA